MPITSRNRKSKKTKRYKKTKRSTKKYGRRTRGGVKGFKTTPITDPVELRRLEEADRIAEERERNDNEIRRINADLERQRINTITSFPSTPMSPEDAKRQQKQDLLDNARVNSKEAKSRKLTVADLGGSKGRHRKSKKTKKSKKIRGGNRIGGNNIGANCNEPNFSIYNTNLLKLFPYKGGSAIPPESNLELLQSPEEEERQQIEQQRLEDERQRLEDEEDINNIDLNELDNIRRQNIQDEFIRGDNVNNNNNNNNNFDEPEMERLSLSDLGGSKQKKSRKSRRYKKRKGGNLKSDDVYKNSEGPQF
jgi:hypothetical protein